ncbi:MAG: MaoC family dehydratase [Chitinophagaceae bacterium]
MINIGDKHTEQFIVTDEIVRIFAEITGDKNPIHLDDEYAATTPFGKRIAHGILVSGFISNILANKLPGPGTIYLKQELNFIAPVFIGDAVEVVVEVIDKKEGKPVYTLNTLCSTKGKPVINGFAIVKFE